MRSWIKGKIKRWYWKYCDPDIVSMTRVQMSGVGPDIKIDGLLGDKRLSFCKECDGILNGVAFNMIIDHIIRQQTDFTVCRAQNEAEIMFGRAQISGAALVREYMEGYASEVNGREEDFDKDSLV